MTVFEGGVVVIIDVNTFPQELRNLPQWVCWRLEQDKRSGRDCKVPYSPATGKRASPTNLGTRGLLEGALTCADQYPCSAIGFMFPT